MGHWVEAGDGYSWVEDPVAPVDTQQNLFGPAAGLPALVGPQAPATTISDFSNMPGLGVGAGGYGGVNIPDTAAALGVGAGGDRVGGRDLAVTGSLPFGGKWPMVGNATRKELAWQSRLITEI